MKRALISVYDKEGIVEFASSLKKLGWEIISTGGTKKLLSKSDIDVLEVQDITKFPEILDGRVKTLNPYIHGGLLFKRENKEHIETIEEMGIESIDIVVNNLYPFEETIKNTDASHEDIIENIDIGGPSMIRAAAKNYKDVTVIVDPKDYNLVLQELNNNNETSLSTRRYLARKVFNYTSYYDTLISNYFNKLEDLKFPQNITFCYKSKKDLRYGENPHQNAAFYEEINETKGTLANGNQIHGKELSFNNINDSNGALKILKEFDEPTIVGVKHANPSGIGSSEKIEDAYVKAYECDTKSIFGGIIASNREINKEIAEKINEIFIEVVLAPSFSNESLDILTKKKNIRLIEIKDIMKKNYNEFDIKKVLGGILIQEKDNKLLLDDIQIVSKRKPNEQELEDLLFAFKSAKHINSNGVVIAKNKATIGIGLGEVNRVWAVENAINRAKNKVSGSVIASDGFFPFRDSIEILAKAGVKAIIQPGGSMRDEEVIEEVNKNNMIMVFTGIRHFKH
ncbi:bifunctional phosphoribosylaminoimidazolecarboxamide formyltransferase/IMP cyclohydrolase [Senegalia massiliensis]|uniref:bifunctional phosphoribosylaminoimidazolecarboxamide formyltransferase/IMP cyclohydrolase n=1 Tax=Senegalia massiliensis TaxID=1720316 RepID=UPI00103030D6|nr:bifunctional phosphoribosylaminoimidazolecarboxamide formyltransferase/IMP cyclohydrolase [Senegalia massiliensis]